jgi:hypothetical protein
MAKDMSKGPYKKDHPENFIEGALTGGHGPSEGIHETHVDRPHQTINTAVAMDNVKLAMPIKTSILDDEFPGGVDNLKHSLSGASAVNEEVGAAGPVRHIIVPGH